MEFGILIKNTSYLASAKILKFFTGIIRSKLIAILLGTAGIGIVSQLQFITLKMTQFTLLGMSDGLVKQIAENRDNSDFDKKFKDSIKSYVIILLIVSLISIVLILTFSKQLTIYVFGNIKYYNYFIIGLVTFPILIINTISYAILKGFKEIKYIARGELIIIGINFLFFIPLLYFFGLSGAVISVTLSFLSALVVNNYFARKKILTRLNISINSIIHAKAQRENIKELFVFAGFGVTTGVVLIFSEIASRSIVIEHLGIESLGLYGPVMSWGSLFSGFILPSIYTYLLPRFCKVKSNKEIVGILNDVLRMVSFGMIPLILIGIPIRYTIIPIFYSNEFLQAGDYLPWHFIGILFYLWMASFTQVFTPTGRIKIYGIFVIIMALIDLSVVYLFVPIIGLYGWMLKFIVSPVIFFIFYFFYFKKTIQFSFNRANKLIMLYILLAGIFLSILPKANILMGIVIGLLLFLAIWFLLRKNEKKFILIKIGYLYQKIKK